MKKYVLAAVGITLFLISSNVLAQTNISAGISVGESYFNVGRSSLADFKYRTGLNIGGLFDLDFSKFVSLEAAPEFTMRGYTFKSNASDTLLVGGGTTSFTNSLGYISIALHSKIKYPVSPAFSGYVLTGPNLGFLVSGKLDSTVSGTLKSDTSASGGYSSSNNVKSAFNTVDFGWDFGFGAECHISQFTPFIEVAYYLDILDINKNFWTPQDYIAYHSYGCEVKVGVRMAIK